MLVLYDKTESNFISNGLAVLDKYCLSAVVREEVNNTFVLNAVFPSKFPHLDKIDYDRIIKAPTPDGEQPFRIYMIRKLFGRIYVSAKHVFFDLEDNLIEDTFIQKQTGAGALNQILKSTQFTHKFSGTSDILNTNNSRLVDKNVVTALIGDQDNSFVNRWGGEIEVDKWDIRFNKVRGKDRGIQILYRKNLTGLDAILNKKTVCTRVLVKGYDGLTLPERYIDSPLINNYPNPIIQEIKFSNIKVKENEDDEGFDTKEEALEALREAGKQLFSIEHIDIPETSYTINFVELSKTEEYKKYKILETLWLGDTVTVKHDNLCIDVKARCVAYDFNSLTKKYINIELGKVKDNINKEINKEIDKIQEEIDDSKGFLDDAINAATDMINSGLGGYVTKTRDELLIMDTEDKMTASKVWRWNLNGLGFSKNGYLGPFETAITRDGKFVINSVTANKISAAMIEAGVLSSLNNRTWINLENGTFNFHDKMKFDGTNFSIQLGNGNSVEQEIQDSINNYKDTVNKELDDIKDAMDNLGDTLDEAFKDGIINEAEAIAIKQQIQNLEIEKKDIDSVYNSLYSNTDLTGTAKNNLYNAKASYNTAHTNLINAINDAIADKKISTNENTLVKRAFANYGTALATFRTKSEEALDAIANKKKQDAIQYTDTQFNILDGKIQSKITSVDAQSIAEQTVNGFKKKVEATYPTNESVSNSFANLDRNLQNTYATKTLVDQTANSITQTVSKKVGKNEIISSINQTAESVKISASKFEIDGTTLLNGQMKMLPTRGSTNYASLYAIKNGNGVNMRVQLGGTQQDGCFEIVSGSEAKYFWVNYQGAHSSNYHYFHTDSSNVGYNVDCLLENGCFRPMVDNKGYLGTQRHYWNQSWITNMYSRTLTTSSDVAIGGDINLSGSLIARYGNIHGNYIGSYGNIMANGTVKGNYLESTGSAKIASNLQVDNTATIKSTVYIGGSLEVKSYGTTLKELEVTSTTTLKGYTVIKNNSLGVEGFIYCNGNIEALQSGRGQINCNYLGSMGNIACRGTLSSSNLSISGSKNCVQETQNYGKRLVNAYETADYLFGDVGESTIENGECIVYLDDIFKEVITTDITYQVFLTKYGKGDIWVSERHSDYFVVQAENDISFGWEIKGKRKGYENYRLEEYVEENKYAQENNTI